MAKAFNADDGNDPQALQALFDSIADQPQAQPKQTQPQVQPQAPIVVNTIHTGGDSTDLEALFDSIAEQTKNSRGSQEQALSVAQFTAEVKAIVPVGNSKATARENSSQTMARNTEKLGSEKQGSEEVFHRLGLMARELHNTLSELGYERELEHAAQAIPDARQRLAYIGQMTEQSAARVLNAIDVAKPIQENLEARSIGLKTRWDKLFSGDLSVDEFKVLSNDTKVFLNELPKQTMTTKDELLSIMMAQDFQDLTGQVIKKILDLAQNLEEQLVQVLLVAAPDSRKGAVLNSTLNGPVVYAQGQKDVVKNQEQVDELLDALGF